MTQHALQLTVLGPLADYAPHASRKTHLIILQIKSEVLISAVLYLLCEV